MKTKTQKRKNFSGFASKDAFRQLGIKKLLAWELTALPFKPSAFFQENLRRLTVFDLTISERAKELTIDAICEEVMQKHRQLKIWKAATLESDELTGVVDYLVTPDQAYVDAPLLCVVEAKRDDFVQGQAQCLVELKACQWNNVQLGQPMDVFGVVTNADNWRFYKLTTQGKVFESPLYAMTEPPKVLGALHAILKLCEAQL